MTKKLEVFYDYTCPYCYKGLTELRSLMQKYTDVFVDFMPCEAHPRPEAVAVHSDLAASVAYYLKDEGLDVDTYNKNIYNAHFEEKLYIEDIDLLCDIAAKSGAEPNKVRDILKSNKYIPLVTNSNNLAWKDLKFEAIPSYRYGEIIAGSSGGKLIDINEIKNLLK